MSRNATPVDGPTVLVVGGGPVGVTLSIALSNYGIDSLILEKDIGIHPLPRAILIDAEAHRSLIQHGVGNGLEKLLTPMRTAEYVDAHGNRLAGQDLDSLRVYGGLPSSSVHFQPELEQHLRHHAVRNGVRLLEGSSARSMSVGRNGDGVSVTTDDGRTYSGRYLVGCDGASSTVRRQLEIGREDLGFDQDWLVVDVEVHDRATCGLPDVAQQVCDPIRPTTFLSGHGRRFRWEFQIQPDEDPTEMNTPERVWGLLSEWITTDSADLIRSASYKFHAGVATTWRVGPVMLAGDAAHQMPPFMGQGLNSGMRDAFNLAWKLKWVTAGWAGEGLLDTYSTERIEHSRTTVEHSVDAGLLIDQYSGRQSHGIAPRDGYGSRRERARFTNGAVAGNHPRVGTFFNSWHDLAPHIPIGADMVLVSSTSKSPAIPPWKGPWSTARLERDKTFGMDHVVVRPDGCIAAACAESELDGVLDSLARAMDAR